MKVKEELKTKCTIKIFKDIKILPIILKKIMYIASNQIFLRLKAEDILDITIKAKRY